MGHRRGHAPPPPGNTSSRMSPAHVVSAPSGAFRGASYLKGCKVDRRRSFAPIYGPEILRPHGAAVLAYQARASGTIRASVALASPSSTATAATFMSGGSPYMCCRNMPMCPARGDSETSILRRGSPGPAIGERRDPVVRPLPTFGPFRARRSRSSSRKLGRRERPATQMTFERTFEIPYEIRYFNAMSIAQALPLA